MRVRKVTYGVLCAVLALALTDSIQAAETTFKYGGYIKLDLNHSYYYNGDVGPESPLRDFHFPAG
ncbi:MAG: hypothetical protein JSW50_03035, partial [Candidatus Latescibacterota bacterium]